MKLELKKNAKIVVKVGSSILTDEAGCLDLKRMEVITAGVCKLKKRGYSVVIVSSGAVACGMQKLGYQQRPKTIADACSCAAVGQSLLMFDYEQLFRKDKYLTAQILLTTDGLHERSRYLNARTTIMQLLSKGSIIPIVNENDAVATDEIRFGDNDRLSAQVAALIDADLLIILSNVDGLYGENKEVIPEIKDITEDVLNLAGGSLGNTSVGGMRTKLEAAKIATNSGIAMVIANGNKENILEEIISNRALHSIFVPKKDRISGKKRWIAFSCIGCGKIIVDDGARDALLKSGRSLLAIGIKETIGNFDFGDLVLICDQEHNEIARGLANYSKNDVDKIKGKKTQDIDAILGINHYEEVIHRNNMVIIK